MLIMIILQPTNEDEDSELNPEVQNNQYKFNPAMPNSGFEF